MFNKLTFLLLGTAIASATPACAADYVFNVTGSYSASFTLSSTPKPSYALSNAAFVLYDVAGTYTGVTSSVADLTFYSLRQGGGFKIHDFAADIDLLTTHGVQLYTGTEAAPTFKLGTYALTPSAGLDRYTLTISSPVASVPESATWGMLLLGFGAVGFALRRRQTVSTTVKFA